MTSKSDPSKKFLNEVCENYELGKLTSYQKMHRGMMQSNFGLNCLRGKYVLRVYNQNKTLESIKFEINLMNYLKKNSFSTIRCLRNKHGSNISVSGNKKYVVFEYAEGHHKKRANLPSKSLESMAKTLAKLHKITKNYKPKYSEYREGLSKEQIKVDLKNQESRLNKKRFQKLDDYIKNNLKRINLPKSLPKGTIHGDYNLGNILFKGEEVSCVLDFDDSCYTYLNVDVASMILFVAWPDNKPLNKSRAKKIVQTYSKYRKISETEKKHIFDALVIIIMMHMVWFGENPGSDMYSKKLEWLFKTGREEFTKTISNQNS